MKKIIILIGALCAFFYAFDSFSACYSSTATACPGGPYSFSGSASCMTQCGWDKTFMVQCTQGGPWQCYSNEGCPSTMDLWQGQCKLKCVAPQTRNNTTGECVSPEPCAGLQGRTIGGIVACMDSATSCNTNAGPSGGCSMQMTRASPGDDIGIRLKGETCFKSIMMGTYTGTGCTSGQPVTDGIPTEINPPKPIENTTKQFCVDGICIQKKLCGEVDKQVCAETTTGGLLCYTQGKCSNTQAPPEPDAPFKMNESELKGKCKVTGVNLDKYCYDQATKTDPTGGDGGSSSGYIDPGSISPPGLSTGGTIPGGENGGGGTTEQGKYCDEHPDALACAQIAKPTGDDALPTEQRSFSLTPRMSATGQCPPPINVSYMGKNFQIKYDVVCEMAVDVKPLVLTLSSLTALLVIIGGALPSYGSK